MRTRLINFLTLLLSLIFAPGIAQANTLPLAQQLRPQVAILDLGETETGARIAEKLALALSQESGLRIVDRGLARAAARGVGYRGSFNLSLSDARALGASMGCDFFIMGDAQTIRRVSSVNPLYFESYASVFIASARTGRLLMWDRPSFNAATAADAERLLLVELGNRAGTYALAVRRAAEDERAARDAQRAEDSATIENLTALDDASMPQGLRLPQPFRRLRPVYTEAAERAEAEATVDALVDIGTDGEVARVEIARWAGFGLDESVIATIRQLHFRPAMRDGSPIASRILLRYNFRRRERTESGVTSPQ